MRSQPPRGVEVPSFRATRCVLFWLSAVGGAESPAAFNALVSFVGQHASPTGQAGVAMWSLSSDDIERVKDRAKQRRADLEERYAAERKAIDAECAELDALERIAVEFSSRHGLENHAEPAASAGEEAPQKKSDEKELTREQGPQKPETEASPDPARWRFQIDADSSAQAPRPLFAHQPPETGSAA